MVGTPEATPRLPSALFGAASVAWWPWLAEPSCANTRPCLRVCCAPPLPFIFSIHSARQLRRPRVAGCAFALIFILLAGFLVGGYWVGSPRVVVRSNEIRSFMACAPGEVLRVSAWEAAVVTALAPRDSNLLLKVGTSGDKARVAFLASSSGICRSIDAVACDTQFPVCATED